MEVISLHDGALRRPLGGEFARNAPLEQVKLRLASQNLPTEYVDIPFTALLFVSGNARFRLDTGFADNGPPTTVRFRENRAAAGYESEGINHAIPSHHRGDHINGVRSKDGSLVCPNAKIHMPAPEHAFWMDDARMEATPPAMKGAFQNVRCVLGGLPADKLGSSSRAPSWPRVPCPRLRSATYQAWLSSP